MTTHDNIRHGLMIMDLAVDRNFSCLLHVWSFMILGFHTIQVSYQ